MHAIHAKERIARRVSGQRWPFQVGEPQPAICAASTNFPIFAVSVFTIGADHSTTTDALTGASSSVASCRRGAVRHQRG
jgi:hypothetical protein